MADEYTPIEIEKGYLAAAPGIPYFLYQRDKYASDDTETYRIIIEKLKQESLYKKGLLYAGFKGISLYKNSSFGSRHKTFAVNEKSFKRSVYPLKWRNRKYINSPLLHMDVEGKSMPALAVFDSSKLVGGEFFFEENKRVRQHSRNAWWTANGESLDQALVAVFFFKHKEVRT